ncbi:MAG TPA: pyridoxamine 5'-phosphate oxidase family protein [Candidatus Saccharimonadales bacterium]|nr:pyridoxamine 5'-phosphate oxidase family protein [Candidatus Saccharimonadales bacterium]
MNKAQEKAYEFLKNHKFAVLSTATEDAKPWGAAVYYAVDKELNFYFLTHTGSKKYRNLQEQPNAAVTVVDDNAQTTVQAAGTITTIDMGQEHDDAFRTLVGIHPPGQYAWVPPVSKLHNGDSVLLKLTPDHLQMSVFYPAQSEPDIQKVV